jgi:hypothetical protein
MISACTVLYCTPYVPYVQTYSCVRMPKGCYVLPIFSQVNWLHAAKPLGEPMPMPIDLEMGAWMQDWRHQAWRRRGWVFQSSSDCHEWNGSMLTDGHSNQIRWHWTCMEKWLSVSLLFLSATFQDDRSSVSWPGRSVTFLRHRSEHHKTWRDEFRSYHYSRQHAGLLCGIQIDPGNCATLGGKLESILPRVKEKVILTGHVESMS